MAMAGISVEPAKELESEKRERTLANGGERYFKLVVPFAFDLTKIGWHSECGPSVWGKRSSITRPINEAGQQYLTSDFDQKKIGFTGL
jgi:hypothetical protein